MSETGLRSAVTADPAAGETGSVHGHSFQVMALAGSASRCGGSCPLIVASGRGHRIQRDAQSCVGARLHATTHGRIASALSRTSSSALRALYAFGRLRLGFLQPRRIGGRDARVVVSIDLSGVEVAFSLAHHRLCRSADVGLSSRSCGSGADLQLARRCACGTRGGMVISLPLQWCT